MKAPVCRHACRGLASGELEHGIQAFLFRFHLWYCFLCWTYERQLRFSVEAFKDTWSAKPEDSEVEALKSRILRKLEERPS